MIEGEIDMKVLICGSRAINDPTAVLQAIEKSGIRPTHIISGGARGVDRLAEEYAASSGIRVYGVPGRLGQLRETCRIHSQLRDDRYRRRRDCRLGWREQGDQAFYLHTKTQGRKVAAHLA